MKDKPYVFKEKPMAKSSTNVMAIPGNPACQSCGCKRGGIQNKVCRCICHTWRE